ncbi:hypothetical protein THRCLA_04302 [Thraustotheca clavata]|uniref:Uncharacterized protein n=1 Tax=Thraustotheca clavata TaxID=74557 RepID=A0A1V9ZZG0_9STRA|nr:hypothetical protein THRCLA_04302 [Thraustotheca clavata]
MTHVKLSGIATLKEYKLAVEQWRQQIVVIDVDFINDVWSSDELEEFCVLLPTLPALKRMSLRWQMDIRDDLLPMPGKIMTAIASSSITDIEFDFEDWFNWDVEITKTFGAWLEDRPVEKVAFDGLFIPHDNIHAPLFCQSLLGSTELKSIAFKGGNITERFFKARHKLPDNIQAIAMDLCSEEIIPDIIASIENSRLREISLKFRQTPPVFGLPGLLAKFNSTFRSMTITIHQQKQQKQQATPIY